MELDTVGVDPAYGVPSSLVTSISRAEVQSFDVVFGDVLDLMQRQARRVEELQAPVTTVGADES